MSEYEELIHDIVIMQALAFVELAEHIKQDQPKEVLLEILRKHSESFEALMTEARFLIQEELHEHTT